MQLILVLAAIAAVPWGRPAAAKKTVNLPASWPICKRNDPAFSECLKNALNTVIPQLAEKGEPSLGVPPIDPLRLDSLEVNQGQGAVSIQSSLRNVEVRGYKGIKYLEANWDPETLTLAGVTKFENPFLMEGDYTIRGKVLTLPITGTGRFNITMDGVQGKPMLKGERVTRDGQDYFQVSTFEVPFTAKKIHVHFGNLFEGNKQLGDMMNEFLNKNAVELLKEVMPGITEAFGETFKQIANRAFSKIPESKIFPAE